MDVYYSYLKANTDRRTNVGFMLGHRRRRWPNMKPTLGPRPVSAEKEQMIKRWFPEAQFTKHLNFYHMLTLFYFH